MPKQRKNGALNTTISVAWSDKNRLRRLAKKTKQTKNGDVYESDASIFNRVLKDYMNAHPSEVANATTTTYPLSSRGESQRD